MEEGLRLSVSQDFLFCQLVLARAIGPISIETGKAEYKIVKYLIPY